jgi:nucleotide-binding universal stress UspA family protein/GNAT superfamily N-acetyltransferase
VFEKVLVPTDLSEQSRKIVAAAGRIPGIRNLVLLHILDRIPPAIDPGEVTRVAEERLELQKKCITGPAITVTTLVGAAPDGRIPEAILRTAGTERPSLIVMGARKGILSGYFLSRGATEILTSSRTHILVLRFAEKGLIFSHEEPGQPLMRKILFPLDFSKPAKDALARIEHLPGIEEIVLLHVIRHIGQEESMNLHVREVEMRLSEARETIRLERPLIKVRMMVRFGDPLQQINTVSLQEQVSLIMMSRYGKMDYIRKVPVGTTTARVAQEAKKPVLVIFTEIHVEVNARELSPAEFYFAEKIWFDYHQTRSDPAADRIFCVFVEDTPVSVARCKRHPDGYEVDGIFTWEEFRGSGYARRALDLLIEACGNETLHMYAVASLVDFYASQGFVPIPENELPASIRERYTWALGDMEAANVRPMKRVPGKGKN